MSEPAIDYLHSLAHALASMQLYDPGHPARAQVVDQSFGRLRILLVVDKAPTFSFIAGAVVYGNLPLHGLRDWPWARRLPDHGVQRLEIEESVEREPYGRFLDDVVARITAGVRTEEPMSNPMSQQRPMKASSRASKALSAVPGSNRRMSTSECGNSSPRP